MATKTRQPVHCYHGAFATASLPVDPSVQPGDTAFDTTFGIPVYYNNLSVWTSYAGGLAPDIRGPRIVVGNQTAGDTILNCDYLDIGDCAQLAVALAAAGGGTARDVWVRPGIYDLGLVGSPVGPLVIPTNVSVRGSGRQSTIIRTDAIGDMSAFDMSANSHMDSLRVEVAFPIGPAGGVAQVVDLKAGATCHNVRVTFINSHLWVAGTVGLTNLRTVFRVSSVASSSYLVRCGSSHNPIEYPPSLNALVPGQYMTLCHVGAGSDYPRVRDCYLVGGDIAVDMVTAGGSITENTLGSTLIGVRVTGGAYPVSIAENQWRMTAAATGTERGLVATNNSRLSVTGNTFVAASLVAGSIGMELVNIDTSVINNNTVSTFDSGVDLDNASDNNVCTGNVLTGITPLQHVINLGAGNEIGHNIEA